MVTERLQAADGLISGAAAASGGVWARAAAWVLRLTIEQALRDLWSTTTPQLARCSMRAQLLVLPKYTSHETATAVSALWSTLSSAAHHHDYELAPTVGELRRWFDDTEQLTSALRVGGEDP